MSPVVLTETPRAARMTEPVASAMRQGVALAPSRINRRMSLSNRQLGVLVRNLETQVDAGVPLLRALQTQSEQAENAKVATICEQLVDSINGGSTFSEALDQYPNVFQPVVRNLIQAGDASGKLPEILRDLGGYLEWTGRIQATLRHAAIYPVMLLTVSAGVIMFILGFVFPRFADLLKKITTEISTSTLILMDAGMFIQAHWIMILATAVGAVIALIAFCRLPIGQRLIYRGLSLLPLFGPVFGAIDLTRLLRNLSVLTSAGVPVLQALGLARQTVSMPSLRADLNLVQRDIETGDSLVQAFSKSDRLPKLVLNMIAVGEESGRLPDVLERVAAHYENESKDKVARAIAMLGPIITVALGIAIGFIVVTIIQTLYTAIRSMGR